ncbi:MAG: hypothetical protein JSW59_06600 [Phycisphaerales bacterium]|nr:MAG: hypothetical protein JSW59_06600 [Phycisphaerales bacterium]
MNEHRRYLKILAAMAVLLGLTAAAWPDAGQDTEPNAPTENRQMTAPGDSQEPNTPAENQRLIAQRGSQELTGPGEDQEMPSPAEIQEPTSPGYSQGPPNPPYSWDTYKIVVERNMFSRQRMPRVDRRRRRQVPVAPPAPEPESYVVLKGIVQQGDTFIAFLEDTQSGQILRVREGDSVVRGRIKTLTLDSIEYEFEDRTTVVTMGLNLQGGRGGTTFTGMYELTQMSATAPAEDTTESSSIPAEDEAEILRQLMERRQQQIGK